MKYLANFRVDWANVYSESDDLGSLIDRVSDVQDLSCLCRQALSMGNKEDEKAARELLSFHDKYCSDISADDVRNLNIKFSIGAIRCTDLATTLEEVRALREKYKR